MTINIPKPVFFGGLALVAVAIFVGLALIFGGGDEKDDEKSPAAKAQTPVETGTTESAPTGCDELGINAEQQNEGTCTDPDGSVYTVVNRDSLLRLDDLTVKLDGIEIVDSLSGGGSGYGTAVADGQFVVVHLTVKNLLDVPIQFDPNQEQVALISGPGSKVFSQDFDAQNGPAPDSFLWQGEDVQPGEEQSGSIVFDIPLRSAQLVETEGNIDVLSFADAQSSAEVAKHPIGIIRAYPASSSGQATATTATQ